MPPGEAYDASSIATWLEATRADVLVELSAVDLATGEPATSFLRAALARGIHGVTANKGPVVHAYRELTALGEENGARFRFESATADCLPIYSLYRESLPLERPHRVRGLMNGTTTVILETIESGGTFDEGVRAAQEAGIAEADPSLDIDGFDSAVKVIAIANVLMGGDLRVADVDMTGIRDLSVDEVRSARAAGTPIRLVATIEEVDGEVRVASRRPASGRVIPSRRWARWRSASTSRATSCRGSRWWGTTSLRGPRRTASWPTWSRCCAVAEPGRRGVFSRTDPGRMLEVRPLRHRGPPGSPTDHDRRVA